MSKTFCISDIHGCYKELMALYKQLPINPAKDKMVFLGDYIDRGPDSKKVIQQLMDWKEKYPHWVVLMGNHETFLTETLVRNTQMYGDQPYDLWMYNGGRPTLKSYLPDDLTDYEIATIGRLEKFIPEDHIMFLATLPKYHEDENYIYVHGGIKPGKSPEETDPYDLLWLRDEFIESDYNWDKKVIFGHSCDPSGRYNESHEEFRPIVMPNSRWAEQSPKIGIDCAVCPPSSVRLCCVELPSEKFYFQEAFK